MLVLSTTHYRLLLAGVILSALALRLTMIERFVGLNTPPSSADGLDQLDYDLFAWRMAQGLGYTLEDGVPTARRTPGTSLLLLPIYALAGHSYAWARGFLALLSALTCAGVALALERPFGRWTALLGAAMLALNPGSFYYTLHLWSEPPFALCVMFGTLAAARAWTQSSQGWGWAAGLAWGCSLLIRPQILFVLPVAAAFLLGLAPTLRRRYLFWLIPQVVVMLAVAAPWLVRNHWHFGKPSLATVVGGMTFWGAHNSTTFHDSQWRGRWVITADMEATARQMPRDEVGKEREAWRQGWLSFQENLSQLPRLLAAKIYRLLTPWEATTNRAVYWAFAISWLCTAPFLVPGLLAWKQRDPVMFSLLLAQLAGVLLCTLLFYGECRFRHLIEPLLMVLAAPGLTTAWSWLTVSRRSSLPLHPAAELARGLRSIGG